MVTTRRGIAYVLLFSTIVVAFIVSASH